LFRLASVCVRSIQPVRRAVCGTAAFLAVLSFTRPILKVAFGSKPVRQIELGTYRDAEPNMYGASLAGSDSC
jgi:hypothetical protein